MRSVRLRRSCRFLAGTVIDRLARRDDVTAMALKEAITSAYSYGALSETDAIGLIYAYGLTHA